MELATNIMTGPGVPGSLSEYASFNAAVTDDTEVVDRFDLYALNHTNFTEGLTGPPGAITCLNTFERAPFRRNVAGQISAPEINAPGESFVAITGGGVTHVETDRVLVGGDLFVHPDATVEINDELSMNGSQAWAEGSFLLHENAVLKLGKGWVNGFVRIENDRPEQGLVGSNTGTPGTGSVHGGSPGSAVTGKLGRKINSATGEDEGFTYPMQSKDEPHSNLIVQLTATPSTPLTLIADILATEHAPLLNIDNLNLGDLFLVSVLLRYGISTENEPLPKRSIPAQSHTFNIRVAVDSIDINDDPNLYRLLLFDYDGEFISEAGTFIPHDGSPPTTALYTGFIDSVLNVSHTDVTITDSVILALAVGEIQTDLDSEVESNAITTFELAQNFPNPFNPETVIQYQVPHNATVRLVVYNILGQPVRTLVDREQTTGIYRQSWNMLNDAGQMVSSGVYMYRVEARADNGESYVKTRKMVVLR
jgi:hypothetical protein